MQSLVLHLISKIKPTIKHVLYKLKSYFLKKNVLRTIQKLATMAVRRGVRREQTLSGLVCLLCL